jgi:hypothetical protein
MNLVEFPKRDTPQFQGQTPAFSSTAVAALMQATSHTGGILK